MNARLLVLDAGSPASSNVIRSLKAADPSVVIVACSDDAFFLSKAEADVKYALPDFYRNFGAALARIVESEAIDLVIPTCDSDVARLSRLREQLGTRVFLPNAATIERCHDKYALSLFLRERGIPAPLTHEIRDPAEIEDVFRRFGATRKLWCRIRSGSGSYGAIPVKTPEQVRSWIAYWEDLRFVASDCFTLSEYLPGRDYCVQCLWDNGRLVIAKMAERLTYLDSGSPSGVSSMPALAKTVYVPEVMASASRAIRALDGQASGVYFVDFKEDENGVACVTEINAGRFATMTNIHDLAGEYNMAALYVRVALGEHVEVPGASDYAGDYYLVRAVDTLPYIVRGDALLSGIRSTGL